MLVEEGNRWSGGDRWTGKRRGGSKKVPLSVGASVPVEGSPCSRGAHFSEEASLTPLFHVHEQLNGVLVV